MKTSALLALANAGSVAFAAVDVYHQCGGSAYTGDTECASGSTCTLINEWYSQCIPGSDNSNNAANTPSWGNGGSQPQNTPSVGNGGQSQSTPSSGSGGDQPESTPTTSVAEEEEVSTESAAATTPVVVTTTPSSGSATITGVTRTLPASSGAVSSSAPITVTGTFDGGMKNYDRSPAVCVDQTETGEDDAMFILEDGATLQNVIIGPNQAEGVHCLGTCTLINVWWEDVCEDALTLLQTSGTSYVNGGGAFHASDKVVQFNGKGTVEISNFYVEDYGKLARSCGNCDENGGPRNIVIDNVAAVNGGLLCGINTNYGDTCTITNSCQDEGKTCGLYTGNDTGDEPEEISEGADGEYCVVSSFSETC